MQELMAPYSNVLSQYQNFTDGKNTTDLGELNKDPLTRYMIAQYVQSIDTSDEIGGNPMMMSQMGQNPDAMSQMGQPSIQDLLRQYANQGAQNVWNG